MARAFLCGEVPDVTFDDGVEVDETLMTEAGPHPAVPPGRARRLRAGGGARFVEGRAAWILTAESSSRGGGQHRTRKEHHMQRSHRAFTMACIFGMSLMGSTATAQTSHANGHDHPDVVAGVASPWRVQRSSRADSAASGATGQISTTADNQILVELATDDTTPANLFDLDGRTLVFTPDGHGGYSRHVRSLQWEEDIGANVTKERDLYNDGFEASFSSPW